MAWTAIDNSLVSVGALPFATTIQALRDNPIAIANGDAGAPPIQTAALSRGAYVRQGQGAGMGSNEVYIGWSGSSLIAQVDATAIGVVHTSSLTTGNVGTYAMLAFAGVAGASEDQTAAGSSLRYTDASGASIGGAAAGTWRCMGRCSTTSPGEGVFIYNPGVWLRIA